MTASFEPYGVTVSPDSTMEDWMEDDHSHSSEERDVMRCLTHLQQWWNRLDLAELAPIFHGTAKRKLYLKDMATVRHGGMGYYSLGGPDRQVFANTFLTLSRSLQHIFLQCATSCLQENRFMNQSDLMTILQEGRGKRQQFAIAEEQHRCKRQRTSLDGIPSSA
jgi:hypothetical protein